MADFPQQFGPYVLERFIAAGGMAEVFLARREDGAIEGHLALKRMLSEMMKNPEYATMFRDEAALSSRLVHKNIVRVFDFGEADGRMYMAMEYIDGLDVATLQKKLRAKNEMLGIPHALKIGVELCAGLFHAHTLTDDQRRPLKLIHRDISPQNLLVSAAGEVKVMDFGIAKATGRETKTATGMIKGKVQYMAPEQALGHHIDQRVDQFAAGIVVWEMLTGTRLFAEKSELLTFEKIIRTPTPKPSSVRSAVPAHVDEVVLRALAKAPEERYPDLNAFGVALSQSLAKLGGPQAADLAPVIQYVMGGGGASLPAPPVAPPAPAAHAQATRGPPPAATATRQPAVHAPPVAATATRARAPQAEAESSLPTEAIAPPTPRSQPAQKRSGLSVVSPATAPTVVTPGAARLPTNAMTPLPMLGRDETPGAMHSASASLGASGLDILTRDAPTMRMPTPMRAMPSAPIGIERAEPRASQSQMLAAAAAPRGLPIIPIAAALVVGVLVGFGVAKVTAPPPPKHKSPGCAVPSASKTDVEDAYGLLSKASMHFQGGDLHSAKEAAENANAKSGSAKGHYMLGTIAVSQGDDAEALQHYRCATLLGPDSDEAKAVAKLIRGQK